MKQSIQLASLFAIASFLTACQSEDSASNITTDKQASVITTVQLLQPSGNDLSVTGITASALPPINQSRDAVGFSQSIDATLNLVAPSLTQQQSSDQYWRTVSGAQLNAGIKLAISQSESVIRIAPRGDNRSGGLIHSPAIAPEQLRLYKINKNGIDRSASMIHSTSDPQAMATAGIIDDSSALTLSKQASAGQYQLQVMQPLAAQDSYLINVKEKGSPYQLELHAPATLASSNSTLNFSLAISNSDIALQPTATLKQSDGQYHQLTLVNVDQQWQAQLPEALTLPSSNRGLSEIQLDIETRIDNKPIIRTVKTAFKQYVPSAMWGESAQIHWQQQLPVKAMLDLQIANSGRYELSAVLVGTDASGAVGNILRSQSALWLEGDGQVSLRFDRDTIIASGLKAPFFLQALELKDQGQMARLSYLSHAAQL
ncbi:DUF4785 domain-containing protein [Shewanella colwelliana]|uniref:DUF4785 domain-containing protein n=1 Tax=Shewanella colwelliana TaxID=23 RepID=UPI0022AF4B66|nr:DUF4785 domain-containing protein [Shewanella colwelliana]MCZ4337977.1 DUF4785 family protein [Shewanella colwelliana]